jgi:hypothetical protein
VYLHELGSTCLQLRAGAVARLGGAMRTPVRGGQLVAKTRDLLHHAHVIARLRQLLLAQTLQLLPGLALLVDQELVLLVENVQAVLELPRRVVALGGRRRHRVRRQRLVPHSRLQCLMELTTHTVGRVLQGLELRRSSVGALTLRGFAAL